MYNNENEKTQTFSFKEDRDSETRRILTTVYNALSENGFKPIDQIVGYIISEDPTYITKYKNARSLICKIDREELLGTLLRSYLGV